MTPDEPLDQTKLGRPPSHEAETPAPVEAPPAAMPEVSPDGDTRLSAPRSAPPPSPRASAQVPGYDVLGVLGRGGMGVVYRAKHLKLNREVALKMILHAGHAGDEERQRFAREAEAVAAVKHPGVVQVYDYGVHDGSPYFALELCEGGLNKELGGRPLEPKRAAALCEQVARGVQAAHDHGIVHRDLKPANILLSGAGSVSEGSVSDGRGKPVADAPGSCAKVTDFGLARRLDDASDLTRTGDVLGTPSYMAPEQASGDAKRVGPAADVYAVGAILYECLTGRPPFAAANSFETLKQVVADEPPAPRSLNPAVPRDLEVICLKCLHKSPERRYQSAAALGDELRRYLNGEPILARPAGPLERAVKWTRRKPTAAAFLASGVLAAALVVALAVFASVKWRDAEVALKRVDQEQKRRALGQIDALRVAAPGAAPLLLEELHERCEEVTPQLRGRYAEETDPAKKARLALALLPVEADSVRDEIAAQMLASDEPAEVVLLRDQLAKYEAGPVERLWAVVGDAKAPDATKLRALVALAKLDPENPRWKDVAPNLVDRLLGSNPLRLGAWILALEPVSPALLGPLGEAFRDKAAEAARREAAAQALALYLTKRPDDEALFGLALDADGKQYALLRPLLEASRAKAIGRMEAELAKGPDYWGDGPPDAAWVLDAKVKGEVEAAGGVVSERWAMCQSLPMDRLRAVAEAMGKAGYRPVGVRPFAGSPLAGSPPGDEEANPQADRLRTDVALVWARDGREWKLEDALTLAALTGRDAAHQKASLIPADVSAYDSGDGVRYLALWRRAAKDEKAVLYADVAQEKHPAHIDALKADKLVPARVQSITDDKGAVRFCGVWTNRKDEDFNLSWDDDEGKHAGHAADADRLLLDVDVRPAAPPVPLRAAWLADLKQARLNAAKQPDDVNQLFFQGVALYNLRRDDEAIEAFEAYHQKSKALFGHRYLALLHARAGKAEQAREALASFAKVNPEAADLASVTAQVEIFLDNADAALEALEERLKAKDVSGEMLLGAGRAYARAAEVTRANHHGARAASLLGNPSLALLPLSHDSEQAERHAGRAVDMLRLALERGYADFTTLQSDADLEAIRDSAGYREILGKAGLNRRYSAVWSGDATRRAEAVQTAAGEAHLARCRELAAQGYRPAALTLTHLANEKAPRAASVWHRPIVLERKRDLARRQGNAAATLLVLKQPEKAWPLFRHSPDPTARTWLVWRAGEFGSDPVQLIERLRAEKDVSSRRAMILALGEYTEARLPAEVRVPLVKELLAWYRDDPDPGVHAAVSWLLRHGHEGPQKRLLDWGQAKELDAIDEALKGKPARLVTPPPLAVSPPGGSGWYVNNQGQTMVIVSRGPVEFGMGSRLWDPERFAGNDRPHSRRIGRSFAIGATAVTNGQWERFLKDVPEARDPTAKRYSPDENSPAGSMTWFQAARYCNWLSEKEGIPEEQWCYPKKVGEGMKLPANHLARTGYRLPTEAELDYAIRAGSPEARYFGSELSHLPRHAHFQANSKDWAWPVGQKRPNDLGLSDAHGNVWNWTGSPFVRYPARNSAQIPLDTEYGSDIRTGVDINMSRVLRGGSFLVFATGVRSANRYGNRPDVRVVDIGLRVCSTSRPGDRPSQNREADTPSRACRRAKSRRATGACRQRDGGPKDTHAQRVW